MLGFNFKRVPVSGEQAKLLQKKMKRIMHNTLNEEDRMEIERRKKYLQSKKQYNVVWEN